MSELSNASDDSAPLKPKTGDKADAILTGALQEFIQGGYSAASMDRIATAAGVSKPTLYSYFRDKEGLFFQLIQRVMPGAQKPPTLQREYLLSQPLRESLEQIAANVLDRLFQPQPVPIFTLVRLIIAESGRFPALAQAFIRSGEKPMLDDLTYLFTHHPDSHAKDPEVMARCFHGSIVHYVILQEILQGRDIVPMERNRLVNGLIDIILCEAKLEEGTSFHSS